MVPGPGGPHEVLPHDRNVRGFWHRRDSGRTGRGADAERGPAASARRGDAAPAPAAKPAAPAPAAAAPAAAATGGKPGTAPAPAPAAASAPPPAAPKPAAELDQLKVFEGSWRCEGKQPAGPFGPEQDYKSTLKGKKDIDNFWIAIEYDQKKSKTHPMPIKARGFLGYDPAAKKYVSIGADNTGGWINESSTGWEGDKLVFGRRLDGRPEGQLPRDVHQEERQGDHL